MQDFEYACYFAVDQLYLSLFLPMSMYLVWTVHCSALICDEHANLHASSINDPSTLSSDPVIVTTSNPSCHGHAERVFADLTYDSSFDVGIRASKICIHIGDIKCAGR
jgi:hypothetical protein